MHVWLISLSEPIPIRAGVRKHRLTYLSEALVRRGHRVTRWGSAFDHITKTMLFSNDVDVELAPNYLIKFIKGLGYKKNISLRRYLDHAVVYKKLIGIAQTMPIPDLILVATPPHGLAFRVVRFAQKHNIPVIVDIRDQWPSIFIERLPRKLQSLGPYLLAWEFYKFRHALAEADAVTAMMAELLQWGLALAGKQKTALDKIFYIGTRPAEDSELTLLSPEIQQLVSPKNGRVIFSFIGTFSNHFNPSIILKVAERFQKEGRDDFIFLLAGSGDFFEEVKAKASYLDNVYLLGWLNNEEIMALLKITDVGICPLNDFKPFFPNKIFIYLSACLPVIASTPGEFESIMKKYNLGLYYNPGDLEVLYKAVISLAENKELRTAMKNNIKKVFVELFDADAIYGKFVDHIEYVAANHNERNAVPNPHP